MRISRKHILILLFFFLASPGFSPFLAAQSLGDTLTIDEISVFSKRPVEQTALLVTRLDSTVLSHHVHQSLSELMDEESPVFVKSLGRGALATVSFRGTAPSHTRVTWNGLELNSPMLGMVDFSEIPVFFIDHISLVHGNSSLIEMPGALGGILDMRSKPGWETGVKGSLLQGAGSYGTWDEGARINLGNSGFQSSTRLFYNHSDNDFKYRNYDTPDSTDILTGKKYYPLAINRNADYTNKGMMQQFAFRMGSDEILDMNVWVQQSERSLPLLSTDESLEPGVSGSEAYSGQNTNRQNNRFFRSAVNYRKYGDKGKFTLFSGLNYNLLSYRMDRIVSGNGHIPQVESESTVFHSDNRASWRYKVSGRDETETDFRYVYDVVETNEKVTTNSYEKSRGEATLSFSWFHSVKKRIRIRSTAVAQFIGKAFASPSFSLGGEYHIFPGDRLYLTASLSSNHRFPTLNDLYFQPGGNPNLRPESSLSEEFGLQFKNNSSSAGHLSVSLSAYHSNVKDWIIWLPSYKGNWEPFNIEKVMTGGVEVNLAYSKEIGPLFCRARGNFALTRSRNFGDPLNWADNSRGRQLPYIPLHSSNVNISSEWKGWSLIYTWNYYSERYTTSSNEKSSYRDSLYPYFMNQVRAGKTVNIFACKLDLSLTVYNLFNETYRSVLQRQMPGRNYQVMARFCW